MSCFASLRVTAVARGIMFLGFPSNCPAHMNTISQEHLEGISSHLAQTITWSQGLANHILVVRGHCDLIKTFLALLKDLCTDCDKI